MTMEGVIRKEDEFIIKIALNHYKKRLEYFRGNESIKRLALENEVGRELDNEIHQIDELLEYLIPDHEYFGFDKRIKVEVYLRVIASSLRQYQVDLAKMRQQIKDEFPGAELHLFNIDDALSEVERVLTDYPVLRTLGRIRTDT